MAAAGVRHFATEQLVVGLVLGRTGRLREASECIRHYWGNKAQFDRDIATRLDAARRAGLSPIAAAAALRANPVDLPAEVRHGKLEKVRRWFTRRR